MVGLVMTDKGVCKSGFLLDLEYVVLIWIETRYWYQGLSSQKDAIRSSTRTYALISIMRGSNETKKEKNEIIDQMEQSSILWDLNKKSKDKIS